MPSSFRSLWPSPISAQSGICQPVLYDAAKAEDRDKLDALVATGEVQSIHDSLQGQLEELVEGRAPHERLQSDALQHRVREHLNGVSLAHYGTYAFFAWRKELLHILPKAEFLEVRTSRNRYQIAPAEQARLGQATIGVLGLSVGSSTALTLALEGIGGELRIADFDDLSLSNTNRLRSPIANIGVNKAVLCAREISEINPYLRVTVFAKGLHESNIEQFMTESGKLDLLIEECDDLFMKVFSRERARHHHIPVIMETSDRGMLDIERFDLEPSRPLLHNLIDGLDSGKLKGLSAKQKVPYVLRIVGSKDTVSPRSLASLFEVSRTTKSWPQLASAISLGAGIATDTARRLLLGESLPSGRYYVDLKKLVCKDALAPLSDWTFIDAQDISLPPTPVAMPAAPQGIFAGPLQRAEAEYVVAYGCLAPSGGNSQPWHFTLRQGRIDCSIPPDHRWTSLDFEGRSLHVAIGAAVENISIIAQSIGLQATVVPAEHQGDKQICSIRFARTAPVNLPQLPYLAQRVTNRHHADLTKSLDPKKIAALVEVAAQHKATLRIIEDAAQMKKIAEVVGAVDRITCLHPDLHRELTGEVRWTKEHAHATGSGIGIDTLELDATDRVGAYLTTTWPAMQVLRELDLGEDLGRPAREYKSHAFALLKIPGQGLMTYLAGGRAMQEVWLEATKQNIGFYPTSGSLYLFARLEQGGDAIYTEAEKKALHAARKTFLDVFPQTEPACEILLFRLSAAGPPSARSLRRPVSKVLTIEEG